MPVRTDTIDRSLFTRRCVACGYDGALLRGGTAEQCVRCGCDLRERPARSYAEMEGLVGHSMGLAEPVSEPSPPERMFRRWLTFVVLSLTFLSMCIWLASEAFSVAL